MINLKKCLAAISLLAGMQGFASPEPTKASKQKRFVSHFENVLGTSMELKLSATTEKDADIAEQAALDEIARLNSILSAYDPNSEFSKWKSTDHQAVKISKELFEVLSQFDNWRERTGGALNASAETIGKVWKQAAAEHHLPTTEELSKAVNLAQQQQWTLNAEKQEATHLTTAPLMLNSFVKSYIINRAADAAMAAGHVNSLVLNIGGDIVVKGDQPEAVMISDPHADAENDRPMTGISIDNKAVATSGNYRRGVQIGDKWYSHIVNPLTGQPAGEIISATVVTPNATDAGALATAMSVLNPAESKALAASVPGTEYLLVTKDGEHIASEGWKNIETKDIANTASLVYKGWNSDFELAINFDIALIEGMRVRRPFVAVWIEDADGKPVRNINVWYNKDRWLPDLKDWYRHYGEAFKAPDGKLKASVSSATRSPGKYSLKWDGKDDEGADTNPGKYTVVIEAAREHGTYQIMKQQIEIKKKPATQSINLVGNVEISAASIELRKRSN
jgi:thiamine biosynthesis lipoprotein